VHAISPESNSEPYRLSKPNTVIQECDCHASLRILTGLKNTLIELRKAVIGQSFIYAKKIVKEMEIATSRRKSIWRTPEKKKALFFLADYF
jgi:hypothetical protein